MLSNRGFTPIFLVMTLGLLIIVAGGAYYLGTQNKTPQQHIPTNTPSPKTSADNNQIASPTPISTSSASIDTSSWATYTDTKNSYSLKYPDKQIVPDDEILRNVLSCNGGEVAAENTRCKSYPEKLSAYFSNHKLLVPCGHCNNVLWTVSIVTIDNTNGLTAKKYIDFMLNTEITMSTNPKDPPQKNLPDNVPNNLFRVHTGITDVPEFMATVVRSSISVDNLTSEEISGLYSQDQGQLIVITATKDKIYKFIMDPYWLPENPQTTQYKQLFHQMLSTIKFTN